MTIDIRAKVFCDKGPVISGGFSDDHVQGTGLIRTRGDIVLEGLVNLRPGDKIQIGYERHGRVIRVPRALRVLSSFADPFKRVTSVSVGCKLSMMEGLRENNIKLAAEDPDNAGIPCAEYGKIPVNISFKEIANECLRRLRIPLRVPLTIGGSVVREAFDYSQGYVAILSDLLYSQSKVGYLDADEQLIVVDLANLTGASPVFGVDDVIDLSPIRSGELPADTVLVEYNYMRLKKPDKDEVNTTQEKRDWGIDVTQGEPETTEIRFNGGSQVYTAQHYPLSTSRTTYDNLDRVIRREERSTTYGAKINSAYVTEHLEQTGGVGSNTGLAEDVTITEFVYKYAADDLVVAPPGLGSCQYWYYNGTDTLFDQDRDTQPLAQVVTRYGTDLGVAGAIGFPTYFFTDGTLNPGNASVPIEITRVQFEQNERAGITKTITSRSLAYAMTQQGQQGLAKMAESVDTVNNAASILGAGRRLVSNGVSVQSQYDRFYGLQKRPSIEERKQEEYAKDPRESISQTEFIQGSAGVGVSVTYSLPWAPDDRIGYQGSSLEPYVLEESQAPELAKTFAKTQQKLTYGHRMGFSVQMPASKVPPYAASTACIEIGGIVAQYLVNGQSWTFDRNGIVASIDMVYLGGVGATDTVYRVPAAWAPVQDGITQMPMAPAYTTNPAPEPPNSIATPPGFDANAPGNIFDTLPTDAPPVYEKEVTPPALVPPYQEVTVKTFPLRVRSDVTRSLISVPLDPRDVIATLKLNNDAARLTYDQRNVAASVRIGIVVDQPAQTERSVTASLRVKSVVEKEAPVSFTVATTTAAPLAGANQTTTTPAGWTEVFSGSVNNDSVGATRWEMTGLPFNFVIDGASYTSFWLYPSLTLGFGSNISFTTPSTTVPAQPKIHVYARRVQYVKKVYSKITANTYRVRVEATETSTSFPRVIEVAFFNPAKFANRLIVEVRVGVNGTTGDAFNVYSATASLGAGLSSKPANASYIFESGDANGTTWTLTKDRHVLPVE